MEKGGWERVTGVAEYLEKTTEKNQIGMEIGEDCGRKYYQPSRKREKGRKFFWG